MVHPNALLISRFYEAFQRRDADAMCACYHPGVEFSDPVFPSLRGDAACAMWRMLVSRGKDLAITYDDVAADEAAGRAHWIARYTFSRTGRIVVNDIHAAFALRDGLIVRHRDSFDLWRWARMSLGMQGVLLGWLPAVQARIRAEGAAALAAYRAQRGASA
jgi:ketosteroid isomerase-like protein